MKSLSIYVFFAVFITTFSQNIFAWDDTGHKLVAYIAWQQMTPAAKEKAVNILLSAPEDSQLVALFPTPPDIEISTYPIGARTKESKRREFFMIASYWADIVRERKFPMRYKYHHGTWHYLDTFWREVDGKVEIITDEEADKENAVERLFHFDKVLRSNANDSEKAIALAWILHLAGDIHQPLHASGRSTPEDPKGGDQGGNTFSLSPKGTPRNKAENLHWYWDSIIVRSIARKEDASDTEYLLPIAAKLLKKYPASKISLNTGKFDQWQNESFLVASSKLYPKSLIRFESPTASYQKAALKISEKQIATGGYRLGALLNDIFDGSKTVAAQAELPCKMIRKVRYPVTKTEPYNQPLEICLLNLCPADKGMMQRPMYSAMVNGKVVDREYDVEKVFKTESEAREYAAKNGIKDVSF